MNQVNWADVGEKAFGVFLVSIIVTIATLLVYAGGGIGGAIFLWILILFSVGVAYAHEAGHFEQLNRKP